MSLTCNKQVEYDRTSRDTTSKDKIKEMESQQIPRKHDEVLTDYLYIFAQYHPVNAIKTKLVVFVMASSNRTSCFSVFVSSSAR